MRCKSTEFVKGSGCDVNLDIPYKLCDLATWTKEGQVTSGAKVGKRIIIAILYCIFFWEFTGPRINPLSFISAAYNSNASKESLDIHNSNSNEKQEILLAKQRSKSLVDK